MAIPFISIIIPTLNGCETLRYTIETTLSSPEADYEVIIADNCSDDQTNEVVASFSDKRVFYVRSSARLNMADNWEFALCQARGRFVMIIGDDDALMPFALFTLRTLINAGAHDVITWRQHGYIWPSSKKPPEIRRVEPVKAARLLCLRNITRGSIRLGGSLLNQLPMIYHSAIDRDIIDKIRSKLGRVFLTEVPDTFTGFVISAYATRVIDIGIPLTVNGWSEKSNSFTMRTPNGLSRLAGNINAKGERSSIHSSLIDSKNLEFMNMHVTPILTAMDLFPTHYSGVKFNYSGMWAMYNKNCNFRKTWEIISISREISKRHNFSIAIFLFFSLLHLVNVVYNSWRPKGYQKRSAEWNIRDFVIALDDSTRRGGPIL